MIPFEKFHVKEILSQDDHSLGFFRDMKELPKIYIVIEKNGVRGSRFKCDWFLKYPYFNDRTHLLEDVSYRCTKISFSSTTSEIVGTTK